jgi:hypothetical protein
MILKLPIIVNNKVYSEIFELHKINNEYILYLSSGEKIVNIIMSDNTYGIFRHTIYLPMKIYLYKNYLYNEMFHLLININRNEYDFFYKIAIKINKKIITSKNKNILNIIYNKLNEKYMKTIHFDNIEYFLNYTFYKITYYLNLIFVKNNIQKSNKIKQMEKSFNKLNINKYIYIYSYYNKIVYELINIIYKNKFYKNFIDYYYKNNKDSLIYLKLLHIDVKNIEDEYKQFFENIDITNNIYSFELFKNTIDKDINFKQDIIDKLILNYTYPIDNYNNLNSEFIKILYYTYLHCNFKININNQKYIYLHTNIIKFFIKYKEQKISCVDNIKIFENHLLYLIIKNLLFKNIIFLNNDFLKKIQNRFTENKNIYDITKELDWITISDNLHYLDFLLNIERKHNFINNIDSKIKSILNKPILFFQYLETENDYYKWLNMININLLFYNTIKVNNYKILVKIIFLFSIVKNQSNIDENYNKLLILCKNNKSIIIYNKKINIKFNEIFNPQSDQNNINLGIFIKHILYDNKIKL